MFVKRSLMSGNLTCFEFFGRGSCEMSKNKTNNKCTYSKVVYLQLTAKIVEVCRLEEPRRGASVGYVLGNLVEIFHICAVGVAHLVLFLFALLLLGRSRVSGVCTTG